MIPVGLYLADTSVIARVSHPAVKSHLQLLGKFGLLATCLTIDLEVGYSSRSPADYATTTRLRNTGFINLPLVSAVEEKARAIQTGLAVGSQHRAAGIVDILTAAIAQHYSAILLHYDSDFDHIARVTKQHTMWIVPRGTLN